MKHIKNTKETGKSSRWKIVVFGGLGVFTPLLLVYLGLALFYSVHFCPNTWINGVKTANMTADEAEKAINSQVATYSLTLKERNGAEVIQGESIDLHTVLDRDMENLISDQNCFLWPVSFYKQYSRQVNAMLKYDEDALKDQIDKLQCLQEENVTEPENAYISNYDNGYKIVKEKQGNKVIKKNLSNAIKKAVLVLEPSISLEEENCYVKPEINSNNSLLTNAVEKMNKIAGAKVTYEFGANTEVLDGNTISKWITLTDDYEVNFDETGIKEYVDYIGRTYNSFGRVRTFTTSYGKTIQVKGGDYGWWLNRGQEVKELTAMILNGEQAKREPSYYQTAQQYGDDDIGDTYVEVNLTAQHLFYYKSGKLILDTDFVSGNVSRNWGTPTGTYPVQYKERDATLTGEDYSTPVNYWMPFNRNIGFHDAPWRSAFGKDIYLTKGSHGCINMPPAKAKKLYENIQRGTAVVVYELKGTENYGKDENKNTSEDNGTGSNSNTGDTAH